MLVWYTPFPRWRSTKLLGVAGKRGRDLDVLAREKLREIFPTGLLENGEIAAVDHVSAERAGALDQFVKMRVQLGRAAGYVERADARGL